MLLVIEILLSVWACIRLYQTKKNWLLGLTPIAGGFVIGFLIGLFLGAVGASAGVITLISVMVDIGVIVALINLIRTAKS